MELGPSLIGLAIAVAVVALIAYMHKVQKNKDLKITKLFMAEAKKYDLNIMEHELWNNKYIIGIDYLARKVFYMKISEQVPGKLIDLAGIARCRVAERSRKVKSSSGDGKVIDRLDLIFVQNNPQKADKVLEFFNGDESLSLRGELPIIEKWTAICNKAIREKDSKQEKAGVRN
jgi:hypothetical protein